MSKALLLGLGNDLLTDDGIGLRVVAALRLRFSDSPDFTVLETAEMGLSLLDLVVGYNELVLVDAIQTRQAPPGFVHEMEGEFLKPLPSFSPHFLGIAEMLALGRELGLAVPARVRIFAIEVLDPFSIGTKLTPALQKAFPGIVQQIGLALPGFERGKLQFWDTARLDSQYIA